MWREDVLARGVADGRPYLETDGGTLGGTNIGVAGRKPQEQWLPVRIAR